MHAILLGWNHMVEPMKSLQNFALIVLTLEDFKY